MTRYDSTPIMAGLKDFQRATVAHVMDRFFGPDPGDRFLVADETGLGKSVVARGVIAQMLERLQDDDRVDRIDIVYVCSNQDIARQNVQRLMVTSGESVVPLSSRLTMLAADIDKLTAAQPVEGKPLNLVAFTPGTSFDTGLRTGKAEERAMLLLLLESVNSWDGWRQRAAYRALQGTVTDPVRFETTCNALWQKLGERMDGSIREQFLARAGKDGLLDRFDALLDGVGRRQALPDELRPEARKLIGDLRTALALAGVNVLRPSLIVLDEFQRFRFMLDPEQPTEGAELAQQLFSYPDARVLLLSATPYKPFTFAEESAAGDDHHADFQRILRFLNPDASWNDQVATAFRTYRDRLIAGRPCGDVRETLRRLLLRVMCRTERPAPAQNDMLREFAPQATEIRERDMIGYAALRRIAKRLDAPMTVEYWKSAPYFLNFVDGYRLGEKVRVEVGPMSDERRRELLRFTQLISRRAVLRDAEIDLGNGRLRELAADTVERGWWQLLWMPPSMPYHELGEPFTDVAREGMTKRLLFSSWNATPTAVAALLSFEAERRIVRKKLSHTDAVEGRRRRARLDYRIDNDRPAAMSTLALFWPHPTLAELCDPLEAARWQPDRVPSLASVEAAFTERIRATAPPGVGGGEAQAWEAVFGWPGAVPGGLTTASASSSLSKVSKEEGEAPTGLQRHVAHAVEGTHPHAVADEVLDDVVAISTHGPGNVAWRALSRILDPSNTVTADAHWRAAATIASGLRSTFNRTEAMLLLDQLHPDMPYWQAVLRYCAAGGLQAVLDEYVHNVRSSMSDLPLTDDTLLQVAETVHTAMTMRPAPHEAFDPLMPEKPIKLPGRFAVRYGGRADDVAGAERQSEVRVAFNSPFWPFVVATTSTGQEGIDFHVWCSAIVHWNTPANPVDFEQREGRVHRFGGHAIRRNIAAAHRADALRSELPDVWKAAFDAARAVESGLGDFAPYWVYPGPAKIERHVLPYPLSRDLPRLERLKTDLVHYRLAFGQPRQEDLLALIAPDGTDQPEIAAEVIDLRPAPEKT
jgi:hypothetical protein